MDSGKIPAETFPIQTRDHPEVRCLGQIQWITDRHDGRCDLQFVRSTDRQGWCGLIYFQHGCPAADVCQKLTGRISLAAEFNCEITRFTSDRVCSVKGSRRVYEKSSTANLAVFIDAVNLDHRFRCPLENFSDLTA